MDLPQRLVLAGPLGLHSLSAKIAPLYVYRPLLNAGEVMRWAAAQDLKSTLPADAMHVTIAYSKTPVDWSLWTPSKSALTVRSGQRQVAALGDKGATVLKFQSANLVQRWLDFMSGGTSWDFDGYKPHVTITYDRGPVDVGAMRPFTGELHFGPETFKPIEEDVLDGLKEAPTALRNVA